MTGSLTSTDTWVSIIGHGLVFGKSDNKSEDRGPRERLRQGERTSPDEDEGVRPSPTSPLPIGGVPVKELVARLQRGSPEALATCYHSLYTPLWRMAIVLTRSRDQADEIIQDVFLSLWGRHEQLSLDMDLRAYLYGAVRNLAKQRARHHTVVARLEDAVANGTISPPALGRGMGDPVADAELQDFYAAFHRALVLLSDRERIALRMRLEDELTFEQIGTILGVSKMGAQKMVVRAEQKIRELLAQYRD